MEIQTINIRNCLVHNIFHFDNRNGKCCYETIPDIEPAANTTYKNYMIVESVEGSAYDYKITPNKKRSIKRNA